MVLREGSIFYIPMFSGIMLDRVMGISFTWLSSNHNNSYYGVERDTETRFRFPAYSKEEE